MSDQLPKERRLRFGRVGLEMLSPAGQDKNAYSVSMEETAC